MIVLFIILHFLYCPNFVPDAAHVHSDAFDHFIDSHIANDDVVITVYVLSISAITYEIKPIGVCFCKSLYPIFLKIANLIYVYNCALVFPVISPGTI